MGTPRTMTSGASLIVPRLQAENLVGEDHSDIDSDSDSEAESDAHDGPLVASALSSESKESTRPALWRGYYDIQLPLNGDPISVSDDVAVFVRSPAARCRLGQLSPAIPRSHWSAVFAPSHDDDDCDAEALCQRMASEKPMLEGMIKKRASEQAMRCYLSLHANKNRLRARRRSSAGQENAEDNEASASGGAAAAAGADSEGKLVLEDDMASPSRRTAAGTPLPATSTGGRRGGVAGRCQANEAARSFTELVGRTQSVLEQILTLSPPSRRRHSVSHFQFNAYTMEAR